MTPQPLTRPSVIEPHDLEAAAAALCCRFGEPDAEARRLTTLHDLLGTSRALARALDDFTRVAGVHYQGIHCAADMCGDTRQLHSALAAWSDALFAAGSTYRAWKGGERVVVGEGTASDSMLATLYRGLADVTAEPVHSRPA